MGKERNKVLRKLIPGKDGPSIPSFDAPDVDSTTYLATNMPAYIDRLLSDSRWKKCSENIYCASICRHLDLGYDFMQITILGPKGEYFGVDKRRCWDSSKMKAALLTLRQIARDAIITYTYWPTMEMEKRLEKARRALTEIARDIGYCPASESNYPSVLDPKTRYTFGFLDKSHRNESVELWGMHSKHYKPFMKLIDILREAFHPDVIDGVRQGRPAKGVGGQKLSSGWHNINLATIVESRKLLRRLYTQLSETQKELKPGGLREPPGMEKVQSILGESYSDWRREVHARFGQGESIAPFIRQLNQVLCPLLLDIGDKSINRLASICYPEKPGFPKTPKGWARFFDPIFPHLLKAVGLGQFEESTVKRELNQWARDSETHRRERSRRRFEPVERW